MIEWTWDPAKDAANLRKHGVSFDLAKLVFDDPAHLSRLDPYPDEERWQTVGRVGGICLFVVHTGPDATPGTDIEVGRVISARKATKLEREAYEQGNF